MKSRLEEAAVSTLIATGWVVGKSGLTFSYRFFSRCRTRILSCIVSHALERTPSDSIPLTGVLLSDGVSFRPRTEKQREENLGRGSD